MRCEVVEIAFASDLPAQPPRKPGRIAVFGSFRAEQADFRRQRLPDRPSVEQFLDFEEIGQRPAVVGHEEFLPGFFRRCDHFEALGVVHCHRLLDVDGLPGFEGLHREFPVRAGRRGHVDDVHLRVGDQRRGVGVAFRHVVAPCEVGRLLRVAAHDGREGRVWGLVHRRAALALADVAAAYDSPVDGFHGLSFG